jgi:hypothetical protein
MQEYRVHFTKIGFVHLLENLRIGLVSKFPLCCVFDFCMDDFMGKPLEKRHIHNLAYRPCRLCYRARKQTYQRAITELLLDTGYLDDKDFSLLPNAVKKLVTKPLYKMESRKPKSRNLKSP